MYSVSAEVREDEERIFWSSLSVPVSLELKYMHCDLGLQGHTTSVEPVFYSFELSDSEPGHDHMMHWVLENNTLYGIPVRFIMGRCP